MNIEIKKSIKQINYFDAINLLEIRLEDLCNNKNKELNMLFFSSSGTFSKIDIASSDSRFVNIDTIESDERYVIISV